MADLRWRIIQKIWPPMVRVSTGAEMNRSRVAGIMANRAGRIAALFGILALTLSAQTSLPRIAIGGIVHETNTFNPKKTTVADFEIGIGGAPRRLRGGALAN